MKLSIHTSQHHSPGYTSLALGIAYTDGLLDEDQISGAIQLAIDAFISSITTAVVSTVSSQPGRRKQVEQQAPLRDSLDEILEQVLREGTHLSAV